MRARQAGRTLISVKDEREHTPADRGEGRGRKVTIAGGGIAALEAILALRALVPDVELELMAPRSAFEYKPMSVLEPFALAETPELELGRFAEEHRVAVVRDTLAAVDPDAHTLATGRGAGRGYDQLLIVTGAVALQGVPGAQPFRGRLDYERVALLLEEYDRRQLRRLVFAVPSSAAWTLPAYELALLASNELRVRGVDDAELVIVTPEPAPLSLFGQRASEEVGDLLRTARISVKTSTHPRRFERGVLHAVPESAIRTDRVIALPRLVGHRFGGIPSDQDGFIRTDEHGRVKGVEDVYAAGDITSFPVKQGGIACQQADAAAESIAARVGATLEPEPFRPVLRGLLLSGTTARYLRSDAAGGQGDALGTRFALWEPASKVFGRHLLPYLWKEMGRDHVGGPRTENAVPVDIDVEAAIAGAAS